MEFVQYLSVWERISIIALCFLTIWAALIALYRLIKRAANWLQNRNIKLGKSEFIKIEKTTHTSFVSSTEKDFTLHPVFSKIEKFLRIDLKSISLDNSFRDLVVKDMASVTWIGHSEMLLKIIQETKSCTNFLQFKKVIFRILTDRVEELNKDLLAEGIPPLVIERYCQVINLFNVQLLANIEEIDRNLDRDTAVDSVFRYVSAILTTVHHQFIFLFGSINGKLKGLTYKGVTCNE